MPGSKYIFCDSRYIVKEYIWCPSHTFLAKPIPSVLSPSETTTGRLRGKTWRESSRGSPGAETGTHQSEAGGLREGQGSNGDLPRLTLRGL